MSKKKTEPTGVTIDRENLGAALHTALRKVCDSSVASLAWNLIYVTDKPWRDYLDHVARLLDFKAGVAEVLVSPDAVRQAVKSAARLLYEQEDRTHEQLALALTLRMFTVEDWEGFVAYLVRA